MAAMGLPPDAAAALLEAERPEGTEPGPDLDRPAEVWPENWPALLLFLRLQNQWHRDPEGRRQGLRFEALQSAMWMKDVKRADRPRLFDELVDMQDAALEVLNGV
jgi:hypothetical protein